MNFQKKKICDKWALADGINYSPPLAITIHKHIKMGCVYASPICHAIQFSSNHPTNRNPLDKLLLMFVC